MKRGVMYVLELILTAAISGSSYLRFADGKG